MEMPMTNGRPTAGRWSGWSLVTLPAEQLCKVTRVVAECRPRLHRWPGASALQVLADVGHDLVQVRVEVPWAFRTRTQVGLP